MLKNFKPIGLILVAGALCFSGNAYAEMTPIEQGTNISQQTGRITGTVEDDFGPVTGATVIVKGTSNGTITDLDGNFTLEGVKNGDVINISFIGYLTQEITYNGQTTLSLFLLEDTQKLDEVVVTALGIRREKKALGYSMQELKGDDIVSSRETNVANALSGKVAGLQVVRSSAGVGGSSKIILRGYSSLTGSNQPLIVVDGVPVDNFVGGVADTWGNEGPDMGSGLGDINPEDIASMSVLKGASAAALYGARAGNGVIQITTKTGKKQPGLGITITGGVTVENIFLKPEFQNVYGQGASGVYDVLSRNSWGPKAEGQSILDWKGDNVPMQIYDNVDSYFGTGTSFNEGISFQQSVDNTSIYASVNRSDSKDITPSAKHSRTSFLLRGTTEFGSDKRWMLDAKINYINLQGHNRPIQGINQSNAFSTIYNLPRSINVTDLEQSVDEDGNMIWWDQQQTPQENPYWTNKYRINEDSRNRFLGTMSLSYKFTDWWTVRLTGGTDYYTTETTNKLHAGGNVTPKGNYTESISTFYENNFDFLSTMQKDNLLGKLGAGLTLGGNLMMRKNVYQRIATGDLLIPNLFSVGNAADKNNMSFDHTIEEKKINSLYGSAQFNWDGWIFLDVTARNDWSSSMSKDNRSYFYPSVTLSAVLSDMILKSGGDLPEWLTFAKIRGSYAEVGNDLDPYQLTTLYSMGKDPYGNPTAQPGSVLYDPSVRSELKKSWEFGAEFKFFDNRLGLDVAYYKDNSTRQLLDLALDPFSGYSSKKINAGNIQSSGVELMAYADILRNPSGLNWSLMANASFSRNKIIDLYEGINEYILSSGSFEEIKVIAPTGGGYGEIWGKKYQRVEEGEHAGKIIVDAQGLPLITSELHKVGSQQPDALLGITNTFNYKNISLSFLIDCRFGGEIYSATTSILHRNGNAAGTVVGGERADILVSNSVVANGDGSYSENTTVARPELYWDRVTQTNLGVGEAFIYDATNVRLRNLTVGYRFDRQLLSKTPLQSAFVSFTANNLWMIHYNTPGIDPESTASTNTNATGVELGTRPTSRSFTFNITLGF